MATRLQGAKDPADVFEEASLNGGSGLLAPSGVVGWIVFSGAARSPRWRATTRRPSTGCAWGWPKAWRMS